MLPAAVFFSPLPLPPVFSTAAPAIHDNQPTPTPIQPSMRTLARATAVALLAVATLSLARDFPKGSPKFEKSLRSALNDAKKNGKPIIAVFSASWCPPCQKMKNDVYPSTAVTPYHEKFNWAYIDTDDNGNRRDKEKFGVSGIPHIQFLDSEGKPLDKQVGSNSPEAFAARLEAILKSAGSGTPGKTASN